MAHTTFCESVAGREASFAFTKNTACARLWGFNKPSCGASPAKWSIAGQKTSTRHWEEFEQQVQDEKTSHTVRHHESSRRALRNVAGEQTSLMRKRSNSTVTQAFSEMSLGIRREATSKRNRSTRNQLSELWRSRPEGKTQTTNCCTYSSREDDDFNKLERS